MTPPTSAASQCSRSFIVLPRQVTYITSERTHGKLQIDAQVVNVAEHSLFIGKRPYAAPCTVTGMGPLQHLLIAGRGLPDTKVGTFTQALYEEAKSRRWTVISMKHDWKRIFSFDK